MKKRILFREWTETNFLPQDECEMSKQETPSQEDVLKAAFDTEEKECSPDVKCEPGKIKIWQPFVICWHVLTVVWDWWSLSHLLTRLVTFLFVCTIKYTKTCLRLFETCELMLTNMVSYCQIIHFLFAHWYNLKALPVLHCFRGFDSFTKPACY